MKKFKPMLGCEAPEDKSEIKFPVLASYKLDGIRAIFHPDLGMVSRSLKPIKNKQLREKFKHLIAYSVKRNIILDGEFYDHELNFQVISSLVMTEDFEDMKTYYKILNNTTKEIKGKWTIQDRENAKTLLSFYKIPNNKPIFFNNPLQYHIFDFIQDFNFKTKFQFRKRNLFYDFPDYIDTRIVKQNIINTPEELDEMFKKAIEKNYEGLIVRNPDSLYKFGRSTQKEQGMLKYKPFVTYDAKVIEVTERFENTNESFKNELGQSTKRNTKDNKVGTGMASAFIVEFGNYKLKVTLTGIEDVRREIFENKDSYIGRMIEFKGMDVGSKDVPRHPVFERFRDDK